MTVIAGKRAAIVHRYVNKNNKNRQKSGVVAVQIEEQKKTRWVTITRTKAKKIYMCSYDRQDVCVLFTEDLIFFLFLKFHMLALSEHKNASSPARICCFSICWSVAFECMDKHQHNLILATWYTLVCALLTTATMGLYDHETDNTTKCNCITP